MLYLKLDRLAVQLGGAGVNPGFLATPGGGLRIGFAFCPPQRLALVLSRPSRPIAGALFAFLGLSHVMRIVHTFRVPPRDSRNPRVRDQDQTCRP